MFGYPVALEVSGRLAVVVGELAVREGKVEGLLAAGALVLVVAEAPAERLERLERDERVAVERRAFRPEDLDGAVVCVASSPDPDERERVFAAAKGRGVLANLMDDPPRCDFAAPAVVRRGELVIAVSTGGRSPALAGRLREELGERFGPEWEEVLALIGEVRDETLTAIPDTQERARAWRAALDHEEVAALVREGRADEASRRLRARLFQGALR